MFLRQIKIGTRLGIGFGAILAFMMVVTIGATALSKKSRDEVATIHEAIVDKQARVLEMKALLLEQSGAMRVIGVRTDFQGMQDDEARVRRLAAAYDAAREDMAKLALSGEEKQILEQLRALDRQIDEPLAQAIAFSGKFQTDEAVEAVSKGIDPVVQKALAEIGRLVDLQKKADAEATEIANTTSNRLSATIYAVALIVLALAVLVAWTVTRSITGPLAEAVKVARAVAAGDLTSGVDATGRDEAAELLAALREMNEGLGRMVSHIRTGAESIAVGAGQVAAGNQQLSSRTEEHASSLEETASTLEEFTTTVRQNAEHAKQASALAGTASDTAVRGGEVVGKVVTTMQEVSTSSKKISDIIGVIDGISFQTNILALNAAVEAARAGEQGRGFAVVASEVRSLAQRSASSAKEIRGLIENSVGKVENGARLVEQAGKTMDELVVAVRKVAEIMTEIAAASHEQSSGIEQINKAITQMDQVVQMNASIVEEATAAATSMAHQATGLARAVAQFRVHEGAEPLPATRAERHAEPQPLPQPQPGPAVAPLTRRGQAPAAAGKSGTPRRESALATVGEDDDWKEF